MCGGEIAEENLRRRIHRRRETKQQLLGVRTRPKWAGSMRRKFKESRRRDFPFFHSPNPLLFS